MTLDHWCMLFVVCVALSYIGLCWLMVGIDNIYQRWKNGRMK